MNEALFTTVTTTSPHDLSNDPITVGTEPSSPRHNRDAKEESGTAVKRGRLRKTNVKGGETIEKMVTAARELLITEGTDRFSMDRIAKRAGVTKGTLLYHFHDKEALLERLMSDYVDHLETELQAGVDIVRASGRQLRPAEELLAGFIVWYRHFRERNASYTSFGVSILSLSAQNDALRTRAVEWYESLFERLRAGQRPELLEGVLMLEGLFFLRHLRLDVTTDEEIDAVLTRLDAKLGH